MKKNYNTPLLDMETLIKADIMAASFEPISSASSLSSQDGTNDNLFAAFGDMGAN